ncbi:response regulator, partial [Moorena sp. SIO3I6]|uniref:response regulator n=1 Tax=Moorena sp. SIO3I6 TaxID=2607831 RepID=UPI0013F7625B
PLIACVDDSPLICQSMEKILTSEGYRFVAINDALRAIATLLATKPELIFLDLVMPNANGYEICGQLRRLSFFRNTPIVILTGNDGIIDRVRAKMVGSSDFMSKPINPEEVLRVIIKHLKQII